MYEAGGVPGAMETGVAQFSIFVSPGEGPNPDPNPHLFIAKPMANTFRRTRVPVPVEHMGKVLT